jgi:hypothetical protein
MIVPGAIGFLAEVVSRYRRTCVPWVSPVAEVLREWPRPVRIHNRISVDARTVRLVSAPIERGRREGAIAAPSATLATNLATEHLHRRRHVEATSVAPVSLVLARTTKSQDPVVATSSAAMSADWPSTAKARVRVSPHTAAEVAPVFSAMDVSHLTDRVVAAIDRRMHATRERLGL